MIEGNHKVRLITRFKASSFRNMFRLQTENSPYKDVLNGNIKVQLSSLCHIQFCPGIQFHFSHLDVTFLFVDMSHQRFLPHKRNAVSQAFIVIQIAADTHQNVNLCVISELTFRTYVHRSISPNSDCRFCRLKHNGKVSKYKSHVHAGDWFI
jgi:hypothetical protein